MVGIHKSKLDTPALIIDRNKLVNNIRTMQNKARAHGKNVRPHAKTHKCSKLAKLQLTEGAIGICATKVSEALVLAKSNITGILITSPVVSQLKLEQLAQLYKLQADTMIVSDNEANLDQLNMLGKSINQPINVIIDIDSGIGRTGCTFDQALELGLYAHKLDFLSLKGIQCYAGHFQHINTFKARENASKSLLNQAGNIKQALIDQTGVNDLIQTGSGTGTYSIDLTLESVNEIQPGSYTVMDKEYFDIEQDQAHFLPAMTLLSTVISDNHLTHVTVDAGLKALYKDPTKPKVIAPHNALYYDWDYFGDEHGKLTGKNLPKNGEVVEMIVPHCDPTINLFDQFYIIENDIVVDIWPIDLRGKSQ